jgi:predicted unusual protein kinase regulating ubiquinone biosynthesis (AarF/ABC1/UbiB family)
VLTLELLRGIWIKEIMQDLITDRERVVARLSEFDTSLKSVSENLLHNTLTQIFEYGVYHADPHGGNLLVMKGGRIGYVDFGITGRIGYKARQQQVNIHIAQESGDFDRFYNAILDMIEVPYLADLSHFKKDVARNYSVWLRAQFMDSRNISEKSFARLMLAINKSAQDAGISFRSMEVRIFRALATVDAILLDFAPNLDVRAEFRRFFTRYNLKTLVHVDIPQIIQRLPAVIRRAADELDVKVVSVIARVSKVRLLLSQIFFLLSVTAVIFALLVLIPIHRILAWVAAIGIGRGWGVALATIVALFFLWLSHMLRLHSVVRDEVVVPPGRTASGWQGNPRCNVGSIW